MWMNHWYKKTITVRYGGHDVIIFDDFREKKMDVDGVGGKNVKRRHKNKYNNNKMRGGI